MEATGIPLNFGMTILSGGLEEMTLANWEMVLSLIESLQQRSSEMLLKLQLESGIACSYGTIALYSHVGEMTLANLEMLPG
mmetsp:Transcript_68645/g.151150  ORF Transcript_68645/g.151150 Transcript_68645/m.151150 type:complete len:81 (+) Transcript_68645:140-382(+)